MTPLEFAPCAWACFDPQPPISQHPDDLAATHDWPAWRRAQTLGARGLLRALLARVAPNAAVAPLRAALGGQPRLVGWPSLGVSLSHDGGVAAVAVAIDRAVGIDVQLPPDDLSERLVQRCLRAQAPAVLKLSPSGRALEFAWIWSVQEACVKCTGAGLAGQPWRIDVPLGAATGRWRDVGWCTLRHCSDFPISCAFGDPAC
ncbi:4'-phosphopantetheinyl transferase family protein [Burkholderia gladioli]|uniref:4'-phosphopantetheinyl transferase family protein n=1 Tax=Burkholderia gladioli TaxID=28095 RepID=UPI00163EC715|nr:4'-phosphopantetheinyl transferase superfamily protein [Burkholderia gladioli]